MSNGCFEIANGRLFLKIVLPQVLRLWDLFRVSSFGFRVSGFGSMVIRVSGSAVRVQVLRVSGSVFES